MEYTKLKEQIRQRLTSGEDFADDQNLLKLGLNSLKIMRLVNQWRKEGIRVPYGELMENPILTEWWKIIQAAELKNGLPQAAAKPPAGEKAGSLPQLFPLTDVQYAYRMGREIGEDLGGIGCHAYLEFDGRNVAPKRLEQAWNRVQRHHPMLRARFVNEDYQQIMDAPFCETIQVYNLQEYEDAAQELIRIRETLSHRRLHVEDGEVAGLSLSLLPQGRTRIHFDLDLLVADVQSMQIILRDLETAYRGRELPPGSENWDFAGYLMRQNREEKDERAKAEQYWQSRIGCLPMGPELPLAKRPAEVDQIRFNRRMIRITRAEWEILKGKAAFAGATEAMLLLSVFAVILERWSANSHFLLNIPLFNRKTEIADIEDVVADFTTLLLLEVRIEKQDTFADVLQKIQSQVYQDINYASYSGVQVQRDYARIHDGARMIAPYVFACNLGNPLISREFEQDLGIFTYMISQTPQVMLDFQSYEDEEGIMMTWDTVDELYPEGLIEDMLGSFEHLLHELAESEWNQIFDVLPPQQETGSIAVCSCHSEPGTLHGSFLKAAENYPDKTALIDAGAEVSFTYKELQKKAIAVATAIMKKRIGSVPIAISTRRGYGQIIAALGILISGNCYVPVSAGQPLNRRKLIHEKTDIQYVIADRCTAAEVRWPANVEVLVLEELELETAAAALPEINPEASAYIIMTSGSTGAPKGVEMAHGNAWNTIGDLLARYTINSTDSVLAVSSLDFDLSVFDIFGLLGSGGKVVLIPEPERNNPEYWLGLIRKHHITIWNTVPILLDMLLTVAGDEKLPLRLAIASGDWIDLNLPERLAAVSAEAVFAAMGGATEAGIWSNLQEVTLPLPKEWKSIPYGRPLTDQRYRVVDEYGRDCPVWVPGELWIGGDSVAKGYRNDPQLTAEKFVTDQLGRWYRTGDRGRFWKDRTIEFLGRKDNQVKIKGHRIELGEIESCLSKKEGIKKAAVVKKEDKLSAFVELKWEEETEWLLNDEALLHKVIDESDRIRTLSDRVLERPSKWSDEELKAAGSYLIAAVGQKLTAKSAVADEYKPFWEQLNKHQEMSDTVIPVLLKQAIDESADLYSQVLRGEMTPAGLFLKEEYQLTPKKLYKYMNGDQTSAEVFLERLIAEIKPEEPILEIGSRIGNWTDWVMSSLADKKLYLFADDHAYFAEDIKKQYQDELKVNIVEFEKPLWEQGIDHQSLQCVVANNALHRCEDPEFLLGQLYKSLLPGGLLIFTETVKGNLLSLAAVGIFDRKSPALHSAGWWMMLLEQCGFQSLFQKTISSAGDEVLIAARKPAREKRFIQDKLKEAISRELPDYMIPEEIKTVERIPISSNGKVNRKLLMKQKDILVRSHRSYAAPVTKLQKLVADIWAEVLDKKKIGIRDKLFSIGGDSLKAARIINRLKEAGVPASLRQLYAAETIEKYCELIEPETVSENTMVSGEI